MEKKSEIDSIRSFRLRKCAACPNIITNDDNLCDKCMDKIKQENINEYNNGEDDDNIEIHIEPEIHFKDDMDFFEFDHIAYEESKKSLLKTINKPNENQINNIKQQFNVNNQTTFNNIAQIKAEIEDKPSNLENCENYNNENQLSNLKSESNTNNFSDETMDYCISESSSTSFPFECSEQEEALQIQKRDFHLNMLFERLKIPDGTPITFVNGGHGIFNPNFNENFSKSLREMEHIKLSEKTDEKGVTVFQCIHCPKYFNKQRLLRRHLICHSQERRFICIYCAKGFNDSFDLKRHTRVHTGVRPYKCNECYRNFTQRVSLEQHYRTVHNTNLNYGFKQKREKTYVCEECGNTANTAETHLLHLLKFHPQTQSHKITKAYDRRHFRFNSNALCIMENLHLVNPSNTELTHINGTPITNDSVVTATKTTNEIPMATSSTNNHQDTRTFYLPVETVLSELPSSTSHQIITPTPPSIKNVSIPVKTVLTELPSSTSHQIITPTPSSIKNVSIPVKTVLTELPSSTSHQIISQTPPSVTNVSIPFTKISMVNQNKSPTPNTDTVNIIPKLEAVETSPKPPIPVAISKSNSSADTYFPVMVPTTMSKEFQSKLINNSSKVLPSTSQFFESMGFDNTTTNIQKEENENILEPQIEIITDINSEIENEIISENKNENVSQIQTNPNVTVNIGKKFQCCSCNCCKNYRKHKEKHHPKQILQYQCLLCRKKFFTMENLKKHYKCKHNEIDLQGLFNQHGKMWRPVYESDIKLNKSKIENKTYVSVFGELGEKQIVSHIVHLSNCGFFLTFDDIKMIIKSLFKCPFPLKDVDFPDNEYVKKFIKKHTILQNKVKIYPSEMKFDIRSINKHLTRIVPIMENEEDRIDSKNIWWLDETLLPDQIENIEQTPLKYKYRYENNNSKHKFSITICCNAKGEILRPFINYKSLQDGVEKLADFNQHLKNCTAFITCAGNLSMISFHYWFFTIYIPAIKDLPGVKLLIGFPSCFYINFEVLRACILHNVELLPLPEICVSNNHLLTDICTQEIIIPWRRALLNLKQVKEDTHCNQGAVSMAFIKLLNFVIENLKEIESSRISNAFFKYGLSPFDCNIWRNRLVDQAQSGESSST